MAYPTYSPTTADRPRPATVTVSSYLLWVTAAVSLVGAILTISMVGRMADVYRELYTGTEVEGSEAVIVAFSVVGVVVNILFAAGLAILAIFNNRGRQGARVTTWVLGGVALCCSGLGLIGAAATSSMNLDSTGTGPSASEVERRLSEALPSWFEPVTTTLSVISLLTILGAIILLALPASNAFFRRPAAGGWDPSMPYPYPSAGQSPYPPPGAGQPPYPPAAGQPPYPPPPAADQPSYPAYPNPGQSGVPPYPTFNDPSVPAPTGPPPATPPPTPAGPPPTGAPDGSAAGSPSDPWSRPPGDDDRRPPGDPA